MNEPVILHETIIIAVICLCVTALIIAFMYFKSKQKIETHRTLQRVLDSDSDITPEIQSLIASQPQSEIDRRRGAFLITISLASSFVLFFIGGMAWMFGLIPFVMGCIYLGLSGFRKD